MDVQRFSVRGPVRSVGVMSEQSTVVIVTGGTRGIGSSVRGKWVVMVVKLMADEHPGERGFAELARAMPGVSHKMLSQTLKALVRDRLVERRGDRPGQPGVVPALNRRPALVERQRRDARLGVIATR